MLKNYTQLTTVLAFLFLSNQLSAQTEILLSGATNKINNGSSTALYSNLTDFGLYDINSGQKLRTYLIENKGDSNLILPLSPISFVTGSSSTFSIISQPSLGATITPGNSISFTIAFDPTAQAVTTATVRVSSNDPNDNPYTFLIRGEGAFIYPDTDGDGVSNNLDVDDDNDGMTDNFEQTKCKTFPNSQSVETVFLNESFGSGTTRVRINGSISGVSSTYCYEDGTTAMAADECNTIIHLNDGKYTVHYSITDADGNPNEISTTGPDVANWADTKWYSGLDHTAGDTNGRMAIFNASHEPGTFYETLIVGVIPNVPINYSFWAINIDNLDSTFSASELPRKKPNITVNFYTPDYSALLATYNTGDITRCTSGNACVQSLWKEYSTSVTFPEQEFIIQFVNNAPGGYGNDLALDDIKITQSLCDLDNDGVADVVDLDNDNDGIPNIIEAMMIVNPDADLDATTKGGSWVDLNSNGWNDIFESGTPADSDGDGVPNYLDLDSDNDTVFDAVENDNFGDIDVNGDGVGEGTDVETGVANDEFDGDGLLGIIDTNDTDANVFDHGASGYAIVLDTDGDGIPNYIDKFNNSSGIFDIASTIYSSYDANNDGLIDGVVDVDKDGIMDAFDTNDNQFGSPRDLNNKYGLYFDGRNDYVEDSGNIVLGLAQATMMGWVKLDNSFATDGIVVGQESFYLRINATKKLGVTINGANYELPGVINELPLNKWTHVAAVFNGSNLAQTVKLYVNGEYKGSVASSATIQNNANQLFRIGRSPLVSGSNYFKGDIEEIRVFNTALTDDQLQKMVYQELSDSDFSRGAIIPLNIPSLSATSLIRYYRMDTYKNDIVDNKVTPSIDLVTGAKLYNIKNINIQTAPLPYETVTDGNWSNTTCWKNCMVLDNITSSIKPWSIIQVKNNITTTSSVETLGLFVDSSSKLNMSGNLELKNNWYIKLDGTIDLQNMSQLVQTANSVLDVTSAGKIERDQQGIANLYNYNYWSSPVSTISNVSNNSGFTLSNVFKDATNPAILQNINWVGGYNGAQTSPLSIASFWLYKFQNLSSAYANWTSFTPTSTLGSAQGFTMKGVANNLLGASQNYAFVGKPNNGTITLPISAANLNLTGNPYPSALDSQEFIKDNIDGGNIGSSNSLTGTLYFWEHAPENNSHVLAAYKGGYATLNLVGGVAPMTAAPEISGLGSSSKIPNRHIPIGQGFFVIADASGGNITFKNSQRAFKLETDNSTTGSNTMIRSSQVNTNNVDEAFKKLRLDFQTPNGFQKQILLGFMNEFATDDIDIGYDSEGIDSTPSDFCFNVQNKKLIIQGVGSFNENSIYPLFIKNEVSGNVKFRINSTENFDASQGIYIHDNVTGIYHDVKNQEAQINLGLGVFEDRFTLRFTNGVLSNGIDNTFSTLNVFVDSNNQINVDNSKELSQIDKVELHNLLGQKVLELKSNKQIVVIDANGLAKATYILRIFINNQIINKKIIIK